MRTKPQTLNINDPIDRAILSILYLLSIELGQISDAQYDSLYTLFEEWETSR